jgi:VWFA-related protein
MSLPSPLQRDRRNRPRSSGAVLGVALTALIGGALAAATPARQAPLVLIDVGVEDPDGRTIAGLSRDDFEIVSGDAARPLEFFAAGKQQPLSLVVLADVSVSMESRVKRSAIREEIERRLPLLLAPHDRVHAGAFARQISISPPFAGNSKAFLTAVRKTLDPRDEETLGPSRIWDAVDEAIKALAKSDGRRAVLLVTDGQASGNTDGPQDIAPRAVAAGVAVSVLGLDWERTIRQDAETGVRVRPGVALEWIAGATGGRYLRDQLIPAEPGPVLERLLADLHQRYTLGFTPPVADGKMHDLDVRVRRSGVRLRARRSYLAPPNLEP